MSKVFTITEGLENMGALKIGGQGSVYKGRRTGEIISAIKIIPTPIFSESGDDKNYVSFTNEVEKLKKVNENPIPHVVKILNSGITDSGHFPFIEMEYIEGPDLEELLKPPHDPVFKIKEVIKVADQLSHALAHCHKIDIKHGDIKSNNVKFNTYTGNYVLLDFGLSVMSDEQRRTSLRHAGAIEYMAPEQNEGEIYFSTDVYGFGVIIYELLAGRVPFPLNDKGESARNNVRLQHIESPVPDVLELRRLHLPTDWDNEQVEKQMQVPEWLINMVYKCLEKDHAKRFADGVALHEYVVENCSAAVKNDHALAMEASALKQENRRLQQQNEQLKQQLLSMQQQYSTAASSTTTTVADNNAIAGAAYYHTSNNNTVSRKTFLLVVLLAVVLGAFAIYATINKNNGSEKVLANEGFTDTTLTAGASTALENNSSVPEISEEDKVDEQTNQPTEPIAAPSNNQQTAPTTDTATATPAATPGNTTPVEKQEPEEQKPSVKTEERYKVTSRAYFYSQPDEGSRRSEYIIPGRNAIVSALGEKGEFIQVLFNTDEGEVIKGWLRKKDVSKL